MGILSRLEIRQRVTPGVSIAGESWLTDWLGGSVDTIAGIRVDEQAAMSFPPFWAGVAGTAESIASLPLKLYRRLPKGREEASDRYEFHLVYQDPNEDMVSMSWRQTLIIHAMVWGNAYSRLRFDGGGRIRALEPVQPDRVTVERTRDQARRLFYRVQRDDNVGPPEIVWPDEMLHVPGPSLTGVAGLRPVLLAKESIGAALAASYFGAAFFGNGSHFGGFLEHPAKLSKPAMERLLESITASHQGVRKAMKLRILEEGMKYKEVGVSPEDAQLTETRKSHVTEAARINRLPPHRIGDLERSTFSNIEHQGIDYVVHHLRPWLVRIEQELNRKLLSRDQRRELYFQHRVEALLRGDLKTRYDAYAVGRQWGWLSADDVREMEDMNPLPDGQGSQYMVPLNMLPADRLSEPTPSAPTPAPDPDSVDEDPDDERARRVEAIARRYRAAFLPLFSREVARIITKEVGALSKLSGERSQFLTEAFGVLQKQRQFVATVVEPAVRALFEALVPDLADDDEAAPRLEVHAAEFARGLADRHVAESRRLLEQAVLVDQVDPRAAFGAWPSTRVAAESEQAAAAAAKTAIAIAFGTSDKESRP